MIILAAIALRSVPCCPIGEDLAYRALYELLAEASLMWGYIVYAHILTFTRSRR